MKFFVCVLVALAAVSASLAQPKNNDPDTVAIRVLKKRLRTFSTQEIDDSIIVYEARLQILFTKNGRWNEAIRSQINSGSAYVHQSVFDHARAAVDAGYDLLKKHLPKDNYLAGELDNLNGVLYYETGDYENAIFFLKKSLAHQTPLTNTVDVSDLATKYNNIAAIVSRMGDYDEAIYQYNKSLTLRQRQGDLLPIGESYYNLSVSYYRKKMFSEALFCQQEYLKILNSVNDNDRVDDYILCYNALGISYFELKEYQKSLAILNKALQLKSKSGSLVEKTYHNLGYVYRMLGDDEKALHFLTLALQENNRKYHGRHPDIGKEYRHMGVLYTASDTEKALTYFQKALMQLVDNFSDSAFTSNPQLVDIRSKPDLLRTLRDKATALQLFSGTKRDPRLMKASLETSRLAMNLIEQMRDEYESESARQFINEEALPVYAGALETIKLLSGNNSLALLNSAFEVIEKSKALLLIESLHRKKSAVSYGVPDSLLAKERRIRTTIGFYEKQLASATAKKDSAMMAITANYLRSYTDQSRLLLKQFQVNFPRYYASRNHFSIASLAEMRLFLRNENSSMVEYFLGEKKIWIFIITPDDVQLIEKERPAQFNQWCLRYKKCLTNYNFITDSSAQCYQQYSNSAYNLHQFLLADATKIIDQQGSHKLIIVPHNELAYLPFESLLVTPAPANFNGYAKLNYVIKSLQISYTYSGSLHLDLWKNSMQNNSATTCIAFGPEFNSSPLSVVSALPHIRNELEAIQNVFDGYFLYGAKATKKIFKEKSGEFGVIHVASHSVMDEAVPSNSRIYFSPSAQVEENVLYAYEIANLSLHTNLVVLSSCETGSGKLDKGEGIMSIGRSFMYAGSSSVLMTLWRSEDKANASLISAFYTGLKNGDDKQRSLHQAKLNYLSEADAFYSHPAFWAGYVLIGHEGDVVHRNFYLLYVMLGGGVMALLVYVYSKKRRWH